MFGETPRAGPWIRATLAVCGAPVAALLALVAAGALAPRPALAGLLVTLAGGAVVARIWLGGLRRLAQQIRTASNGDGVPELTVAPLLPSVQEVADGVTRLARHLAERSALVERLRRADAAILEALPDPLLVLAADRSALRANRAAREMLGTRQGQEARGTPGAPPDAAALLRHPALAEALDQALASGTPAVADLMLPVPVLRDVAVQGIPMGPPLNGAKPPKPSEPIPGNSQQTTALAKPRAMSSPVRPPMKSSRKPKAPRRSPSPPTAAAASAP